MKKINWPLIVALLVLVLLAVYAYIALKPTPLPPPPTTTTMMPLASQRTVALPRVLIFSERNAFKLNYLEEKLAGRAKLQSVNVADEPELVSYYGINSFPAVLIFSPSGKVVYKKEGSIVNADILSRIARF